MLSSRVIILLCLVSSPGSASDSVAAASSVAAVLAQGHVGEEELGVACSSTGDDGSCHSQNFDHYQVEKVELLQSWVGLLPKRQATHSQQSHQAGLIQAAKAAPSRVANWTNGSADSSLLLPLVFLVIVPPLAVALLWISCTNKGRQNAAAATLQPSEAATTEGTDSHFDPQEEFAQDQFRLKAAVLVASTCHFCMSYATTIIAGAMLSIKVDPLFAPLDGFTEGALVSFMLLGAVVGSGCGFAADWTGRRPALMCCAVLQLVGALLMTVSWGVGLLALGRAISGIGVGLASTLVNVYISEVSPAKVRGQLGAWAPLCGTVGILTSYGLSFALGMLPGGAWRVQLGLVSVPAIGILCLNSLMPETPCWLVAQGRHSEALDVLRALFPKTSEKAISAEFRQLMLDIGTPMQAAKTSTAALLLRHQRPLGIGMAINVIQQITGVNIIVYYGPTVLTMAGMSDAMATLTSFLICIVQVNSVFANSMLVDRWGRRPLAIIGTMCVMLGLSFMACGFGMGGSEDQSHVAIWCGGLAVLGMCIFRVGFSFSLSPLPYIMTAELFPQEIRAVGVAISHMVNWATNALVCQTFPMLDEAMTRSMAANEAHAIIFAVYLGFTFIALAFVIMYLPETRGVRLEDVKA